MELNCIGKFWWEERTTSVSRAITCMVWWFHCRPLISMWLSVSLSPMATSWPALCWSWLSFRIVSGSSTTIWSSSRPPNSRWPSRYALTCTTLAFIVAFFYFLQNSYTPYITSHEFFSNGFVIAVVLVLTTTIQSACHQYYGFISINMGASLKVAVQVCF